MNSPHHKKNTNAPKEKRQELGVPSAKREFLPLTFALLISVIGFLLYVNTINHGFVLDDLSVTRDNKVTKMGIAAIPIIFQTSYRNGYNYVDNFYRPIPKTIFALCWQLSPDNPRLGHLINIVLYGLTGGIVFFLLNNISNNVLFSLIASLLFITHPIHTEVVANIKSLDEILAFLFFLISCQFLFGYLNKGKKLLLIYSAFIYFLALMSKESAITFLAIFPLIMYCFSDISLQKNARVTGIFFIIGIIFLLIRYLVLADVARDIPTISENVLLTATSSQERLATAIMILGMYGKLLFFPYPLVCDYSYKQIPLVDFSHYQVIIALVVYSLITIYAIMRIKKKDIMAFCLLFYLLPMTVYTNIIPSILTSFGERFLYSPSFGFCLAIAFFSCYPPLMARNKKTVAVLFSIICIIFSSITLLRNPVWASNYTLYSHDVKLSPASARLHYYFGTALLAEAMLPEKTAQEQPTLLAAAMEELETAIAIDPAFGEAYYAMGIVWKKKNDVNIATEYFSKALAYNPGDLASYCELGIIFFREKNYENAFQSFNKALELQPSYPEGNLNIGNAYGMLGDYDKAIHYLRNAIHYDPALTSAYYHLGLAYQAKGQEQEAKFYFGKASELDKDRNH